MSNAPKNDPATSDACSRSMICTLVDGHEDDCPRPATADAQPTKEGTHMSTESKRIECWRIRPTEGGAWLYETKLANLVDLIEHETSENHSFTLEKTSLSEEEADAMGEFDGW